MNLALGTVLGGAIIFLETRIRAMSAKQVAGGFLGALVGVLFALLLSVPLAKIDLPWRVTRNLNKVAQVRGVQVLNINELANALKPVVLPGEFMRVFILKEGKEYNQGVAYLDDGTMVVVDNARKLLGKNVDVTVTSVLQTTAGKMIFGKAIESAAERAAAR